MKKTSIVITSLIIAGLLLAGCNNKVEEHTKTNSVAKDDTTPIVIIGKTATISFSQFKVEETFVSDTVLHWKIVDEKGVVTEGDEQVSFKKINDNQFFVNWIEKSGLTVSQVLDPENGTVVAYISRSDANSDRGQRAANFLEGTFKFNK